MEVVVELIVSRPGDEGKWIHFQLVLSRTYYMLEFHSAGWKPINNIVKLTFKTLADAIEVQSEAIGN